MALPVVGLAVGIALLWLFGLSWLSALGIAFLISCPAMVLWTLREARAAFGLRERMLDELRLRGGKR